MAKKNGEILITDVIGGTVYGYDVGVTAKQIKRELDALEGGDVVVRINSPGGAVFEAAAIYNLLKDHAGNVHVKIDGLAASAASVVALAGDRVTMASGALLMIHDPWGIAIGDAAKMHKTGDLLTKVKETILNTYESRSTLTRDELDAAMTEETWYTAEEALEAGFVDEVSGQARVHNRFDLRQLGYKHPPAEWPAATQQEPSGDSAEGEETPLLRDRQRRQRQVEAELSADIPAA